MIERKVPTMNNTTPRSYMIGGRTYRSVPRNAVTTNNTEPVQPTHPKVRKPAAGPLLTTENTDRVTPELGKPIPLDEPGKKAGGPKRAKKWQTPVMTIEKP